MKILIIMGGFFPGKKFGGPPVSVDNFCKLLESDDCYIFTYNHEMDDLKPYEDIESNVWLDRVNYHIKYVNHSEYSMRGFEQAIKEVHPDILYLQGMFQSCIMPCLILAKQMNLKVLLAPRGELCVGAFKKKYKKLPYIYFLKVNNLFKNVFFQSTSHEETEAIQKILSVSSNRILFLTNIPSCPSITLKKKAKETGKGKFIFLSRIHPKKNLYSAIKYLSKVSGDVLFDIYGPIEDKEYWSVCQAEIEKLPSNIEVNYRGLVSHDKVHSIFSQYDAFIFPTLSENYGHVIVESLIVGTPVIISDQTPWNDVGQYNAGWALPLEDEKGFVEAIQKVIDCNNDILFMNAQKYARMKMNLKKIKEEYETALNSIIL